MDKIALLEAQEVSSFEGFGEDDLFLGSPRVIDDMVRVFLRAVTDANGEYLAGSIGAEEVRRRILDAAVPCVEALNGRDPKYKTLPFHSPGGIGAYLLQFGDFADTKEEAVAELFYNYAFRLLELVNSAQADEALRVGIDAMIEEFASLLMGVAVPS